MAQSWVPPLLDKYWLATADSMSFQNIGPEEAEIPVFPHVGSFGVARTHHHHEGIDIYAPEGTPVVAMEDGVVVAVEEFTGPNVGSPWWHTTWAVLVEGASGVIVYGEIIPQECWVGQRIGQGGVVGHITPVLTKDKGRPVTMLHLEWHTHGTVQTYAWENDRPVSLKDPTAMCLAWCAPVAPKTKPI